MEKARILVVEDNPDNRGLVCFLLEGAGFQVLQAEDGRQALEIARKEPPDLVLLDMSIPEVDGWTVASRLKTASETRSICVVALTGHTLPGDRKKALDSGCDGYISKPLDVPNFVSQVTAYLDKRPKSS